MLSDLFSLQWTVLPWHDMWGRLSNVASGVAGLVAAPPDELTETRELLNHTQEELRAALQTIEEREREIQNHSRASQVICLYVCLCIATRLLGGCRPGVSKTHYVTRLPSGDLVGSSLERERANSEVFLHTPSLLANTHIISRSENKCLISAHTATCNTIAFRS